MKKTYRRHCPDVRLWRESPAGGCPDPAVRGVARCNLRRHIVHHSPDGVEWGYGGSGPADLALLILHHCLPVGCDGEEPERLFKGKCSQLAFMLHQRLKAVIIARIPLEGATIPGVEIDRWIDLMLLELQAQERIGGMFPPFLPEYEPA